MSYDVLLALKPYQSIVGTSLDGLLGTEVEVASKELGITTGAPLNAVTRLKLVKCSATLASCKNLFVLWTATTGSSASTIATIAGAAAIAPTVAGVALLPGTGCVTGEVFWVAIRGPAIVNCPGVIATNVSFTTDAAGKPATASLTFDTLLGQTLLATTAADCVVSLKVR